MTRLQPLVRPRRRRAPFTWSTWRTALRALGRLT